MQLQANLIAARRVIGSQRLSVKNRFYVFTLCYILVFKNLTQNNMNSKNLNKWKELNQILEDNMFDIKHTLDDWKHCYFSDTFNGSIEYDIDDDNCKILDENNNVLVELEGTNLNEFTLSQYLIEYIGK